jgi:Protein of unknown function (DUF2690)
MKRTRIISIVLAAAVIVFVATAAAITTATAATTRTATSAGDPHYSGCDQSAVTIGYRYMYNGSAYMGLAQLRYSNVCQTEWVTVYYNSGYYPSPSVWEQNQSGTDLYVSPFAPWQGTVWTDQLAGMRYTAACGGVQMYHTLNQFVPARGDYIGWYYIGCA